MSFLMMERDCGLDFRSQISNLRFQISVVRLALAFYLALSCLLCLVVSVVSCLLCLVCCVVSWRVVSAVSCLLCRVVACPL